MTSKNNGRLADKVLSGLTLVTGRSIDGKFCFELEISQIITVFHVEDDRLDVIFKTIDADPDGFPVHGIAVGETTVDSLVGAFGWSPDWPELDPIEILLNRPRANAAS